WTDGLAAFIRPNGGAWSGNKTIWHTRGFQSGHGCSQITAAVGLRIARVQESETRVAKTVDAAAVCPVVGQRPKRFRLGGQAGVWSGGLEENHVGRISSGGFRGAPGGQHVITSRQIERRGNQRGVRIGFKQGRESQV